MALHPSLQFMTDIVPGSRFPSLLKYMTLDEALYTITLFANIIFHPIFHAVV